MSLAADAHPAPTPSDEETPLSCPLCGYSLRGLVESRCPECGYAFDWDELRDQVRRTHPFLFEHHPRHNIWSFFRTFFAALRPRRFWRTLSAIHTINRPRLVRYWLIFAMLSTVPALTNIIHMGWVLDRNQRAMRARAATWITAEDLAKIVAQYGTYEAWLDRVYPLFPDWFFFRMALVYPVTFILLFVLAWPWLTLATLMIFRASMRKAKIIPGHVMRCVIYSGDILVLLVGIALFDNAASPAALFTWRYNRFGLERIHLAAASFLLLLTIRLWWAYRSYLRFDHALATVAASQVIIALLAWCIWLNL